MKGTVFTIIILVIGAMILGAGLYYLMKEKEDKEAKKIYGITMVVGIVFVAFGVIRLIL